jgi:hypothetical protein
LNLQELIVPFSIEASKFKDGLSDISNSLKKTETTIGKSFNTLGGAVVAGAGVAVVAMTGFIADCTVEASKAADIQAQLASVLKSTGGASGMTADAVNGLANSLSQVTKFEDDTIVSAENMLLTFTNIGKDVFPKATETVLDMSQALGQDLKSSSIQLGKALNDPLTGITALSRVGVTFSDQQKKQIESFMAVNDVASAQGIILQELSKEFGGSAKAAGSTLSGKLEILKNQFGNIKETVGGALLPVLSDLATTLSNKLNDPAVLNFITQFSQGLANFALAVVSYIPTVISWFQNIVSYLQNNQGVVVGILAVLTIAVVSFAVSSAVALWAMVSPLLVPIAIITLIIAAVALLYTAWTQNWGGIQETTASVLSFIQSAWQNFTTALTTVWNMFTAVFNPLFQAFMAAFNGDWYTFGQKIREVFDAALKNLTTIVSGWWELTKTNFKTGIDAIINFFQSTDWGSVGTNIIRGIGNGISSSIGWLVERARAAAKAAYDAMRGFLDEHSPSKLTFDIGKNFILGFGNGIQEFTNVPVEMSLNASAKAAGSLGGNSKSGGFSMGDIHITINGNADAKVVETAVRETFIETARKWGYA